MATTTINHHLSILGVIAAATLVAVLVGTKPAAAAFPGTNDKIAFSSNRVTIGNPEGDPKIFAMKPDGTGVEQLTFTASDSEPAWSANGSSMAWASYVEGVGEIFMRNYPFGNLPVLRLTTNTASDSDPAFNHSATKIAFTSDRDGNRNIYVTNADGTEQKRLTNKAESDHSPAFSPDGKKIAFASNRGGGDSEIYVMKAKPEGKKNRPKNVTDNDVVGDTDPDWRPIPPQP